MLPARRRFIIVPHRPRLAVLFATMAVLWAVSLWGAIELTRHRAAPALAQAEAEVSKLRARSSADRNQIERFRERIAVLERSDQVSRAANRELQDTLAEREEEITQLRADAAFYERLVGASGQRQGLTVHSVTVEADTAGAYRYTLTLTQNLKKASVSKGEVRLRVEGVKDGKLSTLEWSDLLQQADAAPLAFAFKYFQKLEGSLMLPAGFAPHRLRVQVTSDSGQVEKTFPWQDIQQPQREPPRTDALSGATPVYAATGDC